MQKPQYKQTKVSLWLAVMASALIAACGTLGPAPAPVSDRGNNAPRSEPPKVVPPVTSSAKPADPGYVLKRGGGFYKDDGPGDNPPADMESIPDAIPRTEPFNKFANRPYTVLGSDYTPLKESGKYKMRGNASWYGKKFHGQKTSTGEVYDMYGMTAAHTTLPIPSYARVTSLVNGKSVIVRVNDRGPFHPGRIIDLSYTAAWKLGIVTGGSGKVEVESLVPGEPLPDTPPTLLAGKVDDPLVASTIAPATEEKALPEIDDASGSWLQLGAFSNRGNAEALKSRLASELGDIGSKLVVHATNNLFRVQLGPWADAQEARSVADKLAGEFGIKPVLVRK